MSLISALGALALVVVFFRRLNPDWPMSTFIILPLLALQLIGLYWNPYEVLLEHLLKGLRSRLNEKAVGILKIVVSWAGAVVLWFLWHWVRAAWHHLMWPI